MTRRAIHGLIAAALAALPILATPPARAQSAQGMDAARGAPTLPDTPAGRRAAEALAILTDADEATTRAYVENSFAPEFRDAFPVEEHLRIHAEAREEFGGFEVVAVRESRPESITLVVRARKTGALRLLSLRTQPAPPHRIDGLGIRPLSPADEVEPPEIPDETVSDPELEAMLGAYLDRLVAADAFSGAVLVARAGEPVFERAAGEASKSYGIPNRLDTKFNLGSMNKMFTAVSIAQLVEAGTLDWGDPIGKWLGPEWVHPDVARKVRIRHLLSHTSGLGSYFDEAFMRSSRALYRDLDAYQPIVREDTLAFEPGTDWRYSNTGFLLLGVIVEKASGQSYYDYVREHVYAPAGMKDTDAYEVDAVVPNLAQGYEREQTAEGVVWRSNVFEHVVRGGPAGGGYSTAPDLLAFAAALRDGRLLRPETLELLTTPKPDLASPDYGFGFGQWEGGRLYGHTGGFPGISAALMIDRVSGDVVVVLGNYGRVAMPVAETARRLLAAGRSP
jgi:CubicO group peptidase (beta-lactamase class C family)